MIENNNTVEIARLRAGLQQILDLIDKNDQPKILDEQLFSAYGNDEDNGYAGPKSEGHYDDCVADGIRQGNWEAAIIAYKVLNNV